MATLVIRRLDDGVKERLRQRAAASGRSMEEEARTILRDALPVESGNWGAHLVATMHELFGPENGIDLELPPRGPGRPLPDFGE